MERNCYRCPLRFMMCTDHCWIMESMHSNLIARWTWMWLNTPWIVIMDWWDLCTFKALKLHTWICVSGMNWLHMSLGGISSLESTELIFLIPLSKVVMSTLINWSIKLNQIDSTRLQWPSQKTSSYLAWIFNISIGIPHGIPPWDPRFFLCLIWMI